MLINSQCVAEAPSRRVATAGSRRLAEIGLGAVVPLHGRGDLGAGAGWMSGIRGGADKATGYLPGVAGSFRPAQLAVSPVRPSTLQATVDTKSTVQNSTDQHSTDQHNTIQVTRLVPATRGGVGPHPVREPGPA
jgi:hypothetical protein